MVKNRRLFKHSAYTTLERFFRILLTLGSFVVVARSLTTVEFGLYSYIFSIYQIFSIVSVFGMDSYFISAMAKKTNSVNETFQESFSSSFYASLIATVLFLIACLLSDLNKSYYIPVIALSISYLFNPFLLLNYLNQFWLDARKNFACFAITGTLFFILRICLNKRLSVEEFIYILSLENIAYALALLFINKLPRIKFRFFQSITGWKDIVTNCVPLVLSTFVILAFSRLDQLFLKWYGYDAEVGYASIATRLFEGLYFFPLSVSVALFPNLAEQAKTKTVFVKSLSQMTFYFLAYALLCIILYFTVGRHLIPLFFGIKYQDALQYLDIRIFSLLFVVIGMVFSRICTINNSNQTSLLVNTCALIINCVLTVLLIKVTGPLAVAYSIVITYLFSGILLWYFFPATRSYFIDIFIKLPNSVKLALKNIRQN